MFSFPSSGASAGVLYVAALLVAGCSSTSLTRAPVEDRGSAVSKQTAVLDARTQAVKQPPGFENAGKPGYYVVKPGDTLFRISFEVEQNRQDIARWNNLEDANKIEVGQVLRVIPPVGAEAVAVAKPLTTTTVAAKPLPPAAPVAGTASAPAPAAPGVKAATASSPAPANPAATPAAATPATPVAASTPVVASVVGEDGLGWIWPGKGAVIAGFDEVKNKGLDIGGAAGDPVLAAADGRVVYAGSGLRGYGNLVILKHNNTYLTAYAHNQTLLVKEEQTVKKGQKIAEMGSTDADRVKLHFEVRKQGKPVDPTKYLPPK